MSVVSVMMAMDERGTNYLRPVKNSRLSRPGAATSTKHPHPLSERTIHITAADPVAVLGPNDQNLRAIREMFPKLNLIARGDELRVNGANAEVDAFMGRFSQLLQHVANYLLVLEQLSTKEWSSVFITAKVTWI